MCEDECELNNKKTPHSPAEERRRRCRTQTAVCSLSAVSHTLTHRTSRASWSQERATGCNSPPVCHLSSAGKHRGPALKPAHTHTDTLTDIESFSLSLTHKETLTDIDSLPPAKRNTQLYKPTHMLGFAILVRTFHRCSSYYTKVISNDFKLPKERVFGVSL